MRRIGVIAGLLLLVLAAFGAFVGMGIRERRNAVPPTPVNVALTWAEVRESPGHKTHLDQEVTCETCHVRAPEEAGRQAIVPCEGCHPTRGRSLHLSDVTTATPECWDCHKFEPPFGNAPWACENCHGAGGRAEPRVTVHAAEFCGNCHAPHQEGVIAEARCISCHITWNARHGKRDAEAKETCVECHGGHLAASEVAARCESCHLAQEPKVTARGHEACTTCHEPHVSRGPERASCESCHPRREALASQRVKEHRECQSCHLPHEPGRAKASCLGCHDKLELSHDADPAKDNCADCHPSHPDPRSLITVDQTCDRCHSEILGTTPGHAERATCTGCHAAHDFRGSVTGAALDCARCHNLQAELTRGFEHSDCKSCHSGSVHNLAPTPACGHCHEPVTKTAPRGHLICADCHEPHARGSRKDVRCASCHELPARGGHGKLDASCKDCHQAHDGAPGPSAVPTCESCHEKKKPPRGLHKAKGHDIACAECHTAHQTFDSAERPRCVRCHEAQETHEPTAHKCGGCHPFAP